MLSSERCRTVSFLSLRMLLVSALAFHSLPRVAGWVNCHPNIMSTNTAPLCTSVPALRTSVRGRMMPQTLKSSFHHPLILRAAETSTNQNDIAVLNERLWSAAELGDEPLIRTLISVGAEVNSQPIISDPQSASSSEDPKAPIDEPLKGPSALHLAAFNGRSKAVCALVELGADVDRKDSALSTALHQAVAGDHLDTVQVLVTLGADLKGKNGKGQTPLNVAKECGCSTELIELLRALTGEDGDTAAPS